MSASTAGAEARRVGRSAGTLRRCPGGLDFGSADEPSARPVTAAEAS